MKRIFSRHAMLLLFSGMLLLLFFAVLLISTARRTSLAYDEVIYAPTGLLYWKTGDTRWNPVHPPLQKLISALPLLTKNVTVPPDINPATHDEWRVGYRIFFQSPTPATELIFLSRLPTITVSLVLGLFLWIWIFQRTRSAAAAGLGLAALVFDPLALANGALAMNDMFVTLFFFTAVFCFEKWAREEKRSRWEWVIASGLLTGAAISSKLTGLLLVPFFGLVLWQKYRKTNQASGRDGAHLVLASVCAVLLILTCYRFDVRMMMTTLFSELALHKTGGPVGYLLGPVTGSAGWYYYPIAAMIKTPLALLCLWGGSLLVLWNERKHMANSVLFLLAPVIILWAAALITRNHFGLRYLLPTSPFLAVLIGEAYAQLKHRREKVMFGMLALWLVAEALWAHPHHMAYFNQIVGGSAQGYKWLDGSNQDWGQDLPTLAAALKQQNPAPSVLMGYWGSNRPEAWGIKYQDVYSAAITNSFRLDEPNPVDVKREWLIVSATLLTNPSTKEVYYWLRRKNPIAFLGHTLFVYDITQDLESTLTIAQIYSTMERYKLAERQLERARVIKPGSRQIKQESMRFSALVRQNETVSPGAGIKRSPG